MVTAREPNFAQLLRQHRKAAGISQEELARRALLSRRGISDLERGASQAPRADTLALLADALDLCDAERARFLAAARRGRLSGPPARASASHQRATPPAPLVGRADELALIARFLAGEDAPLLLLAGEPGIGKTRLLREAIALGAASGWMVLEGGCAPASAREPYAPVVEALARHCATQPPAQLRERLRGCAWLPRLLPELAERGLAPLPQWSLPPEQERRLIAAAVATFLANVAGPAGTLLALDDLQWANPDALDLLAELLRVQPERPIRIIGVYRDTETLPQSPLGALLAPLARDELLARRQIAPLSAEESRTLLDTLLEQGERAPDAALVERVLERSGGAPFFLVSCARAVRTGALGGASAGVPWDAAESVRLRAALLPETARRLLGVAAVVGRSAARALLAEVMGTDEEEALARCEQVCETRLMREDGPDGYAFTHDIIREAAYDDLSAGRRRLLHRQIAEALARGVSAAAPQVIADHYERAGETAQAITQLERAAAQAAQAGAYREVKRSLEHAIALAPEAEHRRLYEALGDQVGLGLNDTPVPAYRAALALWRAEPQPDLLIGARLARKLFFTISTLSSANQEITREEMAALREEMRRLAEVAGDEEELWRMRVADVGWYWWTGETGREQAPADMALCLEAAAYFEARGDWEAFNRALDAYGTRAIKIGAWEASADAARRRLAAPPGGANDRGDATMAVSWAQLARGQYIETIATVRSALETRQPGEPISPYSLAISHASAAARFSGAWSELDALLAWQEEGWDEQGRAEGLGWISGPYELAFEVALARGDHTGAEQAAATLARLRPKHSGFADTEGVEEIGSAALLRDDPATLLELLASLPAPESDIWGGATSPVMFLSEHGLAAPAVYIDRCDAAPPEPWYDAFHRAMAINRALAADVNTALAAAIDDAEAHGLIPHAARMRIILAQRTGDRAQLERARPLLERLGDRQFLRRLEAVAASLS